MGLPEHTSASQLKTYSLCPRKYALRYLEQAEPEDKSPSLVLGSVFHSAIGWFFEERLAGRDPTVDGAIEICHADFAAAVDGPPVRWGRWNPGDLLEHCERLVRFFLEQEGRLEVTRVEQRFEVSLEHPVTGEPLPRPFVGYLDLEVGKSETIELKTSRSAYSEVDIISNLQFGAYSTVLPTLGLESLSVWVIIKTKQPRLQKLRVLRDPARERWFFDAALAIEKAIADGHFPPAPGWSCSSCEYRARCLGPGRGESLAAAA